jgi:purine-binding chemotaxis protein CheW
MVVAVAERTIGLLVDAVSDIIEMTDDAIQPTPDIGSDRARGFVKGILAIDGRMVSMIDLNWILPEPESEAA